MMQLSLESFLLWSELLTHTPATNPNKIYWFLVSVLCSVIGTLTEVSRHVCSISLGKVLTYNSVCELCLAYV